MELTTTDCPWCITDTDSVLCTIEHFSFFQSLRDISNSASVTVSAVKFVFANTNLLTYLLPYSSPIVSGLSVERWVYQGIVSSLDQEDDHLTNQCACRVPCAQEHHSQAGQCVKKPSCDGPPGFRPMAWDLYMLLRRLHDSGAVYKYPDLLTYACNSDKQWPPRFYVKCPSCYKSQSDYTASVTKQYQRKLGSKQAYCVVHQPVSRGFAVFADAWLSGWLAEISADLRETVSH